MGEGKRAGGSTKKRGGPARREGGARPGPLQWVGRAGRTRRARLHEVARSRSRQRRRSDDRLCNERAAIAAAEWLSAPPGSAGLVFDLLGQDAQRYRSAR